MILYCINRREKAIAQVEEQLGSGRGLVEATSFDNICSFLDGIQSRAKCRQIVNFLYRLGMLERKKQDHSWVYALSELGKKIVVMIDEDEAAVQQILYLRKSAKGEK